MPPGQYERKVKTREEYINEFWSKVNKDGPNGCWVWTGRTNSGGYGQFSAKLTGSVGAHRISFELINEPIMADNIICHACDNPPCVNPEHLWQGTHADNMQDAINKGRIFMPKTNKQSPKSPMKRMLKVYQDAVDTILREDECRSAHLRRDRIMYLLREAKIEADEIFQAYKDSAS